VFIGNDTLTGEIDQVISNAVDEATVLAAASANSVTFDGGVMGGGGGWNAQSGASDYPSTVGLDGPGGGTDGVDYCGPAWADRTGRQVDQIAATFGIKVSNLVAGVPMKCTVQGLPGGVFGGRRQSANAELRDAGAGGRADCVQLHAERRHLHDRAGGARDQRGRAAGVDLRGEDRGGGAGVKGKFCTEESAARDFTPRRHERNDLKTESYRLLPIR